jgi:hypothetical protein
VTRRRLAVALSLLVLFGVPVAVVLAASTRTTAVAPADPHRPSAPFVANTGDGVRPDGIGCVSDGAIRLRAQAHLDVFADGRRVTIPKGVGVRPSCTYWLHTTAAEGVIAIASPQRRSFSLGDFFDIWGAPLGRDRALSFRAGRVRAFVDGKRAAGDPRAIDLRDRREIALVIGRAPSRVPARFPSGG